MDDGDGNVSLTWVAFLAELEEVEAPTSRASTDLAQVFSLDALTILVLRMFSAASLHMDIEVVEAKSWRGMGWSGGLLALEALRGLQAIPAVLPLAGLQVITARGLREEDNGVFFVHGVRTLSDLGVTEGVDVAVIVGVVVFSEGGKTDTMLQPLTDGRRWHAVGEMGGERTKGGDGGFRAAVCVKEEHVASGLVELLP